MRFDVLTLFPELFAPFETIGITRRAHASGALRLHLWPLRDFAQDTYRRIDDRPYGGGPGMVMMAPPLIRALDAAQNHRRQAGLDAAPVLLMSPVGRPLTQARVRVLVTTPGAVLVCGRYEGVDQRFIDQHVDEEISLGDFVLSGGELPALTLLDAVARLLPGVLGDQASHEQDSFSAGLLDHPHYTRPEVIPVGQEVPSTLLGGHHASIAQWRREQALRLTQERRPELIQAAREAGALSVSDERYLRGLGL